MTGRKTHDHQLRTMERKEGLPKERDKKAGAAVRSPRSRKIKSEFAVSRSGMKQESEHNEHNKPPAGPQR
jgi:hypothetical protein